MRTTIFTVEGERVVPRVVERPRWQPLEEYDGKPLERVRADDLIALPDVLMQLVEIGARGQFAMHSSPDIAFCQIIRGKGRGGLPDGGEIAYTSPELYVFLPGTCTTGTASMRIRSSPSAFAGGTRAAKGLAVDLG